MRHRVRRSLLSLALLGLSVGCTYRPPPSGSGYSAFYGKQKTSVMRCSTDRDTPSVARTTAPGTPFVRHQNASPFAPRLIVTNQVSHGDLFPHAFDPAGPGFHTVQRLYRGQYAYLIPLAANYGTTANRHTDVTYELTIRRPDGSHDGDTFSASLWQGFVNGPEFMLYPSTTVSFHAEAHDLAGDYQVTVRVTDHLAGETQELFHTLTVEDYREPELPADFDARRWFTTYYQKPSPELALPALSLLYTRLPADQRATALPSLLGFYDQVLNDNSWLLPAFSARLAQATPDEAYALSVVLGYHLRAADTPPTGLDFAAWVRLTDFRTHVWSADTDAPLSQPSQLDTLWGRFFASGLYSPVERILATLAHHADLGAADRWQQQQVAAGQPIDLSPETLDDQELFGDPGSPPAEVRRDVLLRTALWSLRNQAHQHSLVRAYLTWVLQVGELPAAQENLLVRILAAETARPPQAAAH